MVCCLKSKLDSDLGDQLWITYSLSRRFSGCGEVARRKLTAPFLDIKKAYDTVHRDGIWKRLLDVGIRGKLWRVLRNLYEIVESCVLVGKRRTEWFSVEAGVRQGCLLSPILFAIFFDGLANAIKQVQVGSVLDGVKLNIL